MKKIAKYKYQNTNNVKINIGKNKNKENYIPNLSKAKKLGLKAKISLDMQIKDSLNYYHDKKFQRVIAFDLDGTLIDSAPDITNALNYVLLNNNLKKVELKDV